VEDDIRIDTPGGELRVPRAELTFRATRSGGAGGQHVNTSATRIELWWDVAGSAALDDAQRAAILERLATRIDAAGSLRIVASRHRSQNQNREEAVARLEAMLLRALTPPKPRRRTRPPRASKEARLRDKKHRSEVKRLRQDP
jgi:ribosome-associated protein